MNYRQRAKRGGQQKEENVQKGNKYRFGEFGKFRKSQWRFVTDTPIAGPFAPGQARKTAGQNAAEKKIVC